MKTIKKDIEPEINDDVMLIASLVHKCTQLTDENNRLKAELKHWTEREIITTEKK